MGCCKQRESGLSKTHESRAALSKFFNRVMVCAHVDTRPF